jgi:hypothetical protein
MMTSKSWLIAFVLVSLVFIFGCQIMANVAQWNRGPFVHAWMEDKRNALLFPQFFENVSSVLLWPEGEVALDRMILKQYKLSAFSQQNIAEIIAGNPDHILRFPNWYDDNWIGRQGYAIMNAESEDNVSFDGYAPEFIPKNHIEVRLNNETIFARDMAGGEKVSFDGGLRKGTNEVAVSCDREVSPVSIGVNSDARPIAFRLLINRK